MARLTKWWLPSDIALFITIATGHSIIMHVSFSDWWSHSADRARCVRHCGLCGVDATEGKDRSDRVALWACRRWGATDHLPPPAHTQPVFPAGECVCVQFIMSWDQTPDHTDAFYGTTCHVGNALSHYTVTGKLALELFLCTQVNSITVLWLCGCALLMLVNSSNLPAFCVWR